MQIALNSTVSKCFGVVSLLDCPAPAEKIACLRDYLSNLPDIKDYAIILHDRDVKDDGTLKTPHLHYLFLHGKTKKKSTWINAISNSLGVSPLAVSLESYSSFEACLQYMLHKNNPEKAQYDKAELCTSIPDDEIDQYLSASALVANMDYFVAVVDRSNNLMEVMREVGIGIYQHYRIAIIDIWTYRKGGLNCVSSY